MQSNLKGVTFDRKPKPDNVRTALKVVTMIRYIDDFIDNHIWHNVNLTDPRQRERMENFIDEFMTVGQTLEPKLSRHSFEIFKVELQLQAVPTQRNLDANIQRLFRAKAYDIMSVYCQVNNVSIKYVAPHIPKLGIADVLRDFYKPAHSETEDTTDFNLYNHIRDNDLNPDQIIKYIQTVFKKTDPDLYERYVDGESVQEIFKRDVEDDVNILIILGLRVLKSLK